MDRKIVYGYIRQFVDHARRATGLDASSWMIVMMPKSRVGITCDLAQAVDPAVTRGTRIRFEIAPNIVPITFVPPSKPALMSTGDIACQRTDSSWFTCEFLARSIDFPSFFFFCRKELHCNISWNWFELVKHRSIFQTFMQFRFF